jgi:hypothetical protein
MMDNHESWFAELNRRKEVIKIATDLKEAKRVEREVEQAAKPKKSRECSHPSCRSLIDITTAKLKRENEILWSHCTGKNCTIWGCEEHRDMVNVHMEFCIKIAR